MAIHNTHEASFSNRLPWSCASYGRGGGNVGPEGCDAQRKGVPRKLCASHLGPSKREYIVRTYGVHGWTDSEDFLNQIAIKTGRLLKGERPISVQSQSKLSMIGNGAVCRGSSPRQKTINLKRLQCRRVLSRVMVVLLYIKLISILLMIEMTKAPTMVELL